MNNQEGHRHLPAISEKGSVDLASYEALPRSDRDFHFAMQSNGYYLKKNNWEYDIEKARTVNIGFIGRKVAFFGPGGYGNLFSNEEIDVQAYKHALDQKSVTDLMKQYRGYDEQKGYDEQQTERIAYLLGGIVRHMLPMFPQIEGGNKEENDERSKERNEKIKKVVDFAARATSLGDQKSGEAVISSIANHIISGGSVNLDDKFRGDIYHMATAISENDFTPVKTEELGILQVGRLRNFLDTHMREEKRPFPDITEEMEAFRGFPTSGAEFHFDPAFPQDRPTFWPRIALLNMSQYEKGSYIQYSRIDRDVVEVRMNPSFYPITIANWNHMRMILPELNRAYFHSTVNRQDSNFTWDNKNDGKLINKIRAVGMLSYAGVFDEIPTTSVRGEFNLGSVYLGQTVRKDKDNYSFTGSYGGREGYYGQLSVYSGFGENFPHMSYYLSMALANPDILESIPSDILHQAQSLRGALEIDPVDRNGTFRRIQDGIMSDSRLRTAHDAGVSILEKLNHL